MKKYFLLLLFAASFLTPLSIEAQTCDTCVTTQLQYAYGTPTQKKALGKTGKDTLTSNTDHSNMWTRLLRKFDIFKSGTNARLDNNESVIAMKASTARVNVIHDSINYVSQISNTRDDSLKAALNAKASKTALKDTAASLRNELSSTKIDSFFISNADPDYSYFNNNSDFAVIRYPKIIRVNYLNANGTLSNAPMPQDENGNMPSTSFPFTGDNQDFSLYYDLSSTYQGFWVYVLVSTIPSPTLSFSGQNLSISGGNSVTIPSPTLSFSGQNLSISGGNSVTIPFLIGREGFTSVAIGTTSLQDVSANYNTAIGSSSLRFNTTGERNTAIGQSVLSQNTTGFNNTAIGRWTLGSSTGSGNTAIGSDAGLQLFTGNSNIMIGYNAQVTNGLSNQLNIGNWITGVNGYISMQKLKLTTMSVYANDAAADADSALLSGTFYKLTGSRIVYQKP